MSPEIELEHSKIDEHEETLEDPDEDPLEKEKAMKRLGEIGASKSIPKLEEFVENERKQKLVSAAARTLGEINSFESLDFLNKKIIRGTSSGGGRWAIAGSIRHRFSNPVELEERADSIDKADDIEEKIEKMDELKDIKAPESAERMLEYLDSDNEEIRSKSKEVIRDLGHRAILPLKEAAEEGNEEAMELLEELGPELGYTVNKKEKRSFFEKIFK